MFGPSPCRVQGLRCESLELGGVVQGLGFRFGMLVAGVWVRGSGFARRSAKGEREREKERERERETGPRPYTPHPLHPATSTLHPIPYPQPSFPTLPAAGQRLRAPGVGIERGAGLEGLVHRNERQEGVEVRPVQQFRLRWCALPGGGWSEPVRRGCGMGFATEGLYREFRECNPTNRLRWCALPGGRGGGG